MRRMITLRQFILSPRFDPIVRGTRHEQLPLMPSEAIFCTDGSEGAESEEEMAEEEATEDPLQFRIPSLEVRKS
jgi:hypothetical protein